MAEERGVISALGLTPEHIVGYVYSGALAVVCAAVVDAKALRSTQEALGVPFAIIAVATIGVVIYTFYFKILGEFVLFPLQYLVHHLIDLARRLRGERHTATISFLIALGVPRGRAHFAYQEIKAAEYEMDVRQRTQLSHGEIHIFYLTSTIVGGAAGYSLVKTDGKALWLAAVSLLFLVVAIMADTVQQSLETAIIRSMDRARLLGRLRRSGFLERSQEDVGLVVEHVGLVSARPELFDRFWCEVLGYEKSFENRPPAELFSSLFGVQRSARVARYSRAGSVDIEVHTFTSGKDLEVGGFDRLGWNHVALRVGNRTDFLLTLPLGVRIHRYDNPGGWENIFIQDYEGNWIEVREDFP